MPHRRPSAKPLRAAAVALLLAAPLLLSSCGFNYATDRINTISAGINDRSGEVDVLGAVVIAQEPNAGAFVATLVNGSDDVTDQLVQLGDQASGLSTIGTLENYPIEPRGRVSLIQEGGVPITGSFGVGDFVDVTLAFQSGQVTTVQVPVVRPCNQYSPEKLTTLMLPTAPADAGPPVDPSTPAETNDALRVGPDPYSCDIIESTVAPNGGEPGEGEPAPEPGGAAAGAE